MFRVHEESFNLYKLCNIPQLFLFIEHGRNVHQVRNYCTENPTIPILETSRCHIQIIGPLTPQGAPAVGRFQPGAPYMKSSKAGKVMRKLLPDEMSTGSQSSLPSAWPTAAALRSQQLLQISCDFCQPMGDPIEESTQDTLIKLLAYSPVQKSGKAVSCLIHVTKTTPSLLWV